MRCKEAGPVRPGLRHFVMLKCANCFAALLDWFGALLPGGIEVFRPFGPVIVLALFILWLARCAPQGSEDEHGNVVRKSNTDFGEEPEFILFIWVGHPFVRPLIVPCACISAR